MPRSSWLIPPKPLHWSVGHDATVAQRIVSDAIAAPLSTSIGGPRPSWPVGRGRPRWCARSSWPEPRASATPGKTRSTPLRLAFHVNKIPISAAIEGRGAQDMVALVLRRRVGPIRASNLILGKKEVDMLNSMKSSATEKDRNAAANAPDVMGRVVQPHDQAWARSEPTTKTGMASCIGSDMSIVGNIECKGPAEVFGRTEGEVRASDLQINDGAQVEGSVIAQNVTVCVRVKAVLSRTVKACIAARIATGEVVHLDATLIRANVSWDAIVEAHADAVLTELDSTPAPSPEVATTSKTQRICQTDPDASLGKGGRLPRVEPAYKQQTAVDTKQGVILDVEVTTGGVHDSNTLSALDEVPRVTGRSITMVTLDAGYGVARVFAELEARRIEAIVPTRREPSPKKGVIPARRFKLDARHDRLRCPRGRHLVPHSKPNAEGFKVYRSSIRDCRPCPLRAACFSPNAQRRTVLLNKDHPALLRARRRHLAWTERERIFYASHRARVEGVHGEEKAWHGLARAVRRGLANMKIQAYLTAAAVNLKRLAAAVAALLLMLLPIHRQSRSYTAA